MGGITCNIAFKLVGSNVAKQDARFARVTVALIK